MLKAVLLLLLLLALFHIVGKAHARRRQRQAQSQAQSQAQRQQLARQRAADEKEQWDRQYAKAGPLERQFMDGNYMIIRCKTEDGGSMCRYPGMGAVKETAADADPLATPGRAATRPAKPGEDAEDGRLAP